MLISSSPPSAELVDYSLAQQANQGEENQDTLLLFDYQIHDLVLDYLKYTITQEQQVGTLLNISTSNVINTMG